MINLKPVNLLIMTSEITQLEPSPQPYKKTVGEVNIYIRFVYAPNTICNHTQGQVLVSINADPEDAINRGQKSTKLG